MSEPDRLHSAGADPSTPPAPSGAVTRWLEARGNVAITAYASIAAFLTYFAMYAYRKPFSAATYDGEVTLLGGVVALKTAFVIAQLIGYTASKYAGVPLLASMRHHQRPWVILALIGSAEIALLGFGGTGPTGKVVCIFLSGLPLGAVWGVVVSYLEGRRSSEVMLAVLSSAYIVASGATKDAGRWLMSAWEVDACWMPAATGLLFAPMLLGAVWMLAQTPEPNAADVAERCRRTPMDKHARRAFLRRHAVGLAALMVGYVMLTAFRDFRDNFGAEMFAELGLGDQTALFTRTEVPVAVVTLAVLGALAWVRNHRAALLLCFGLMAVGMGVIAASAAFFEAGRIGGVAWMTLIGLGAYLAYVPFGSVLFDRILAHTRATGTAVFAIYLLDAGGYTGSVALQLTRDVAFGASTRYAFFIDYCYLQAAAGVMLFAVAAAHFTSNRWTSERHT